MRKRSLFEFCDWLLWTLIGLIPFIYAFIVVSINNDGASTFKTFNDALVDVFTNYLITSDNNVLYKVLEGIFISGNYGLRVGTTYFMRGIAFFGTVQIVHFVFDVVLFIPRLAMRFCDKFSK